MKTTIPRGVMVVLWLSIGLGLPVGLELLQPPTVNAQTCVTKLKGDDIIQIKIRRETPDGVFNDAIYMTKDEREALTDEQIQDMKQARVQAWRDSVQASKLRPPPKKQDLKGEKDALIEQKAAIQVRIDELTVLIQGMP